MKHAEAIAAAVAQRINAADVFDDDVVVDLCSRWVENEEVNFPPTIQLVSVKRNKIDRGSTAILYTFLFRRALINYDLASNLDAIAPLFEQEPYINVDNLGAVYFDSFVYNAPTRTTTNGVSLQGAFDSAVLENDGYMLQTALINIYRIEG